MTALLRLFCVYWLIVEKLRTASAQCHELLWSEEFDGSALDTTKWTPQVGDGCDLEICGWGNNEWQSYTAAEGINYEVSGGTLKIAAIQQGGDYTSARIRSLGKADFDLRQPLYIESRIKVPKNSQGLWPAFWMLPSEMELGTWPLGGEIDIMEFIGKEPNNTQGYMHYGKAWNDKGSKGGLLKLPEHVGEDFHVIGLEKTPNSMTWSVDGHAYQMFTKDDIEAKFSWPFEQTYHFIINLAVGGNWPEYPDATTVFPNRLEVDYIRVYKLDGFTMSTGDEMRNAVVLMPRILGPTLVQANQQNVQFCVQSGEENGHLDVTSVFWSVPEGATFTATNEGIQCASVTFGMASGYVESDIVFSCGHSKKFSVPVEVQDAYGAEFTFVSPNDVNADQATYDSSTGSYIMEGDAIVYTRKLQEVYDSLHLSTAAISDPNLYVQSAKKFYMDAKSLTAAPCTRIFLQLENGGFSTPGNYPRGRHSRYIAFLQKESDYQRLEFDFYDKPDTTISQVDRIVILFDSFMNRNDTYYFRNLVSAAAGCDKQSNDCEPLSTNTCKTAAKSEEGACADGFNNDGFGYNGDGYEDCADSDCWNDPACQTNSGVGESSPAVKQDSSNSSAGESSPAVEQGSFNSSAGESSPAAKQGSSNSSVGETPPAVEQGSSSSRPCSSALALFLVPALLVMIS